jgi:hypothetical protein
MVGPPAPEDVMRSAFKTVVLVGLGAALAACGGNAPDDQNFAIDNIGNEEVETLPADESSVTPSDALVNGSTDDPDVPTADNQTDAY